jgi:tetrahedral aminopeptidase
MNADILFDLLKTPSPTGNEDRIKKYITDFLANHGIETVDHGAAGLSWELGAGDKLAVITSHIDQVACVVERIDDEGYIYIQMPGIDPRIAVSQVLTVWGRQELKGVIGMTPPHYLSPQDRNSPIPREKLFVDLGLSAGEVRDQFQIGDFCTWDVGPCQLLSSRVTGAGLDNRISLFLSLLLTVELKGIKLPARLRFAATTQEEGPMLGAGFAGQYALRKGEKLSFAMVLDATFASSPGSQGLTYQLGKGPTLGVGPILSRSHLKVMRSMAEEIGVLYVLEPLVRNTGTEADVLSLFGEGIPSILVSIPIRNMHSPVEVADLSDVESALELLKAALCREDIWNA